METEELFMRRCIELALNGAGYVSPNPMVGAVITHNGKIIGEGWHRQYGEAHAEVNAVKSVSDKSILPECEIYVNLEPCSHHGKTPPCAELLVHHRFKKVITGMRDPFKEVAGRGIAMLKEAGIEVAENVLKEECMELNRRFITFHTKDRPYVLLKWAQSADGFMAPVKNTSDDETWRVQRDISGPVAQRLVHKWRSEHDAILVGTNTALLDNPFLDARLWPHRHPVKLLIDRDRRVPASHHVFKGNARVIVFTEQDAAADNNVTFAKINFADNIPEQMLEYLFSQNIQSLLVEGGAQTLRTFIESNCWDEARVFTSANMIHDGVRAPAIAGTITDTTETGNNHLITYRNQ